MHSQLVHGPLDQALQDSGLNKIYTLLFSICKILLAFYLSMQNYLLQYAPIHMLKYLKTLVCLQCICTTHPTIHVV